jgi:hypothetical protein
MSGAGLSTKSDALSASSASQASHVSVHVFMLGNETVTRYADEDNP